MSMWGQRGTEPMTRKQRHVARHAVLNALGRDLYRGFHKFQLPESRVTRPHKIDQTVYVPPPGFVSRTLLGDRVIR